MPAKLNKKTDALVAEWVQELAGAGAFDRPNDEGLTTREWQKVWQCSKERATAMLQKAAQMGWIKVGRKNITKLSGIVAPAPCYKFTVSREQAYRQIKGK